MIFTRTGNIVRDIGLIYFSELLEAMGKNPVLENNTLEFEKFDYENFVEHLFNLEIKEIEDKKEIKVKLKERKGFPYIQNSSKFGMNCKIGKETSIKSINKNLEKIIELFFILNEQKKDEQKDILKSYLPSDNLCNICNQYHTTKLDITHKDEKIEREISKYIYSFLGSENNSFNNYGTSNIAVCFVCEFFTLMFLLFVKTLNVRQVVFTNSLKQTKFLNYKLSLKKDFGEKAFLSYLGRFKNVNFDIYDLKIDPKMGIILTHTNTLNIGKLLKEIKLLDLIDNFKIEENKGEKKELLKLNIKNKNYKYVKEFLLSEIMIKDNEQQSLENIRNYIKILLLTGGNMEQKFEDSGFWKLGKSLGALISNENKKNIGLKLVQFLKSDDKKQIFDYLTHLIMTNGVELPNFYSDNIFKSDTDQLRFYIGKFLEGFLNNIKEQDGGNNNE